jgi:rubrerythrin
VSTRGLEFSNLSLRDALDLAILVEAEAEERYIEFAQQMEIHHTPEAAEFFHFMARNEAKHGAELATRRQELFGTAPVAVDRGMLFDVEAPEYDRARAFMTARQAMETALASEEKAHDFFVAALPRIQNADVHALFVELRDEEILHQELVWRELEKLPPDPPDVHPGDFADEPVAQ